MPTFSKSALECKQVTARPYQAIDHVVIRTVEAEALYELFGGQLGLPITWPLQRAAFATFGWIGLGNTNLEIWEAADNSDLPADCVLPLFHQIALAPTQLDETIAGIQATGLACKAPRPYASKDQNGVVHTNFTNSVILDLSNDACCVFICEWGDRAPIAPWTPGLTTPQRRAVEREALNACRGGRLGIVGLRRMALTSRDVPAAVEKWRRLTGSQRTSIMVADDIELSLFPGSHDRIQSLTLAVRDLSHARRFLAENDLLEERAAQDDVVLARRVTGGLTFRLVGDID
ncbi:hypothetical protein [Ottowia thiooxydans]|uniref:hypothetical protein n=1 Tax=Ottowia thiooxydans TaxID=219182 RepID=UPI000687391A|nr:hypothetical protein [Ottowia thiooxydans]